MSSHIRFNDNTDDEFGASDSEEELTESDKNLLKKARKKKAVASDSEEDVFGVHSDSAESDLALSDVEGQGEEDDLPDARAWGKDKRNYYSTDYVDPDYGGFQGRDASLAELEEQEARTLQKQLAEQLDDDDFSLGILSKQKEASEEISEEVIKTDLSELSKRQKLQLLQKESPEFFGLIEDYEVKMNVVQNVLYPIIKLNQQNKVSNCKAIDFCNTYNELIMNYCTNIYMYLLLKANRMKMQTHPVIKRLCQYRHLMAQMEPVFEEIIKPQVEVLLADNDNIEANEAVEANKNKTLKVLAKLIKRDEDNSRSKKTKAVGFDEDTMPPAKKQKSILKNATADAHNEKSVHFTDNNCGLAENSDTDEDETVVDEEETKLDGEEVGKRGITYQIKKNKGLTPHRKKEQRNPRVKHRNKFRKANIRRKGAVREVRTEKNRYDGEMSGIKASVTKSIKIR